jgi:tricorn protease
LIPAAGGAEHKVTFDSSGERQPRFSADGKKLYFVRNEGGGGGGRGGRGGGGGVASGAQIYSILLERQDKDPDDPEDGAEPEDAATAPAGRGGRGAAPANQPVKEANIDWDGIKRRTLDVTRMPYGVQNYIPAYDSKTLILTTSEPAGGRNAPAIYSVQDDGKQLTRIGAGAAADDGAARGGGRGRGAGGFGGIGSLNLTRDGRTLFYQEAGGVYSITIGGGGGGAGTGGGRGAAAATGTAAAGGGARKQVTFAVKVKVNKPAEWAEMFDDAWRTMKYRFYDANMHGFNWDSARAKYQPLVEYVADKYELLNIVNEMIGELNASHTGAAAGPGGRGDNAVQTSHLGLDLVPDDQAGRYRVSYVYADGPCDKDWVKV